MANDWFNFTLGFAADGPDLDTVRCTLDRLVGWTVNVTGVDVIVGGFEQDDNEDGWPVFIVGHTFNPAAGDTGFRGSPVRIPLAGASITVY